MTAGIIFSCIATPDEARLTFQLLTLPSGNLHTLTFWPEPMLSPVSTSLGTPNSEFSSAGPALLARKNFRSLGPCTAPRHFSVRRWDKEQLRAA